MLALGEFSVSDLAALSEVRKATVRTVLRRERQYVEEVGIMPTGRRGGQPVRWRLRPETREHLRAQLEELERLGVGPWIGQHQDASHALPAGLIAAEHVLLRLTPAISDPVERAGLIKLARTQIDASDACGSVVSASTAQAVGQQVAIHRRIAELLLDLAELEQLADRSILSGVAPRARRTLIDLLLAAGKADEELLTDAITNRLALSPFSLFGDPAVAISPAQQPAVDQFESLPSAPGSESAQLDAESASAKPPIRRAHREGLTITEAVGHTLGADALGDDFGRQIMTPVLARAAQQPSRVYSQDEGSDSFGQDGLLMEPNRFVGRQSELVSLKDLLSRVRLLTLCGPAGIGKTRLAVELASEAVTEYPDGAWLVELANARDAADVARQAAAALGIREEPGRTVVETLADELGPKHLLLVLDACERLAEAAGELISRLISRCPRLSVIATSREPLGVRGEAAWRLPPLWLPQPGAASDELLRSDAIRLFADRAAAARPGYALNTADSGVGIVAEICRVLDGLPLAIELAAARVRALSAEQIAVRLVDRFALLASGDRAATRGKQILRATMDWSYDLLTGAEQVLLRRLSVFAGWSLEMAEQVCVDGALPSSDVLDLLTALIDKSLVVIDTETRDQTRYRMLDTIRAYAAARLAEAGESAMMQERLRDYALAEIEHLARVGMALVSAPSWSTNVEAFRRFEAETGNLRQVLGQCLAVCDAETGLRICTAMRSFWIIQGSLAEGSQWFDAFLALDAPGVTDGVRGAALVGRAQLALATDPDAGQEGAKAGLELCRSAGEEFWIAAALNLLAEIELHAGRGDDAAVAADEALTIARTSGDRWNEGYALGTRGAVAGLRGDVREAKRFAEAALQVMRNIDQQWGIARTLLGLGDLDRLTGESDLAYRRYTEALVILREFNVSPELARCLVGLGRIAIAQGDLALAKRHFTESIQLSQSASNWIGVIRALDAFADLAVREGSPVRAVRLASAAAALRATEGLPPVPASRTQRILDAAASLGDEVIRRLWSNGSELTSTAAVALALDIPPLPGSSAERDDGGGGSDSHTAANIAGNRYGGGLSAREREVANLIARGYSNSDIARELFIRPSTAARHVVNIMVKLGLSSRVQVAAWVANAKRVDTTGE